MDKISSILPGSPRVTSVDLKEAAAVRAGVSSPARTEAAKKVAEEKAAAKEVAKEAKVREGTTAQKGAAVQAEMTDWKSKDAAHASMVGQLSDKFFNRVKPAEDEEEKEPVHTHQNQNLPVVRDIASKPAGFKSDELRSSLRESQMQPFESFGHEEHEEQVEQIPRLKQPEGLYPKGSFIDRTA